MNNYIDTLKKLMIKYNTDNIEDLGNLIIKSENIDDHQYMNNVLQHQMNCLKISDVELSYEGILALIPSFDIINTPIIKCSLLSDLILSIAENVQYDDVEVLYNKGIITLNVDKIITNIYFDIESDIYCSIEDYIMSDGNPTDRILNVVRGDNTININDTLKRFVYSTFIVIGGSTFNIDNSTIPRGEKRRIFKQYGSDVDKIKYKILYVRNGYSLKYSDNKTDIKKGFHYVRGFIRKNGQYVKPHFRGNPEYGIIIKQYSLDKMKALLNEGN